MTEWIKKKMFYVTRWKLNAVNVILILFTKFPSVCSHNALEICSVDVNFKRHENLFFIYISKDIKCKIFGYVWKNSIFLLWTWHCRNGKISWVECQNKLLIF